MSLNIGSLDPVFTNIISNLMVIERQPLIRLEQQKDTVSLRNNVYTDLNHELEALQELVTSLTTSDAFSVLSTGRATSVTPNTSDTTVLTASASSYAIEGTYVFSNITRAQAHTVRSDQQTYVDQALDLSGTFVIGGDAARSQATQNTIANTVIDFAVSALDADQLELGTGTYYVETREDATDGWQFRVVDAEGSAVSVQLSDSSDYSTAWQAIPAGGGVYDSGRGLTITFDTDSMNYVEADRSASSAAEVDYTAQGASISVDVADSLNTLASAINDATFAEGNAVVATVVDGYLMLAAEETGTAHSVVASDASGSVLQDLNILLGNGNFANAVQSAGNATFTVNGVTVTRGDNSGIDDVISGVTINLAADAEGESASLTVSSDVSTVRETIDSFIDKFNHVLRYLQEKTSVSAANEEGGTYSRGVLADDYIFNDLRRDLVSSFITEYSVDGIFASLRQVGLTLGDDLQVSVSDSSALNDALINNFGAVSELFDSVMGQLDTKLAHFTGTDTGYLNIVMDSADAELSSLKVDITSFEDLLVERKDYYIRQYAELQAQLVNMAYMQQQFLSIYGGFNSLY